MMIGVVVSEGLTVAELTPSPPPPPQAARVKRASEVIKCRISKFSKSIYILTLSSKLDYRKLVVGVNSAHALIFVWFQKFHKETIEASVQPTLQLHRVVITWVKHSGLAAPCWAG